MKPGERVDAIKAIVRRLTGTSEFDRREVDLVLDEFGLASTSYHGGAPEPYVTTRVQSGNDEALQELLAYLEPSANDNEVDQRTEDEVIETSTPWESSNFRVFISHCTSHVDNAKKLRTALTGRGVEAFVAHESIQVSQKWEDVLLVGLRTCDAVVAILTTDFMESDWCEQEIGVATAYGKLIVPLQFGITAHGFFGKYQGMNVHGGDPLSDIARKVFEALLREPLTRRRMADVVVGRFIDSESFDTVRKRFGELKMIPDDLWTPVVAEQIRTACEENGQISSASIDWKPGPQMVESLLKGKGL